MRIGIDFDDSISETTQPLFEALNIQLGKAIPYSDDLPYDWEDVFNVSQDELHHAFFAVGQRYSFHKTVPLYPNCKEILIKLKNEGHELFIISARGTWELSYTTVWLRYHDMLSIFTNIIHRPPQGESWSNYKVRVAKEFHIDIFIEDSPKVILELTKAEIPVIMIDRPYNQEIKAKNQLWRVRSWKEVPEIINNRISANHSK